MADEKSAPQTPFWEMDVPAGTHPPAPPAVPVKLRSGHPRLIFMPEDTAMPGARTFTQVRDLHKTDTTFQNIFAKALELEPSKQSPVANAACWIVTQDDKYARAAIDTMLSKPLSISGEPYYSEVWAYALAYDWLYHHPLMTVKVREQIVSTIKERLISELAQLDGFGMALWHGRNQSANGVMMAALAIGDLPEMDTYLQRAAAHFIESLRALKLSEGWPEGASYWIYNRAGPYARAADSFITATGRDEVDGIHIRDVMRRIGLWSVYQYAPNGVFEPYGDSAGSLRLGETGWWELSVDHYARISRDPGLAAGADYLRNRSPDPYGKRPYYWNIVITYDPTTRPAEDYDPRQPELWMRKHLPQAMLFGQGFINTAFFRGDWGDLNELYASFKAGDLLAHHDHYDAGTFTIQRGGELAARSGFYADYFAPHRLGYYAQTVAVNSILIMVPGESSGFLERRYPQAAALAGGQRVIRPTGFSCVNLAHFGAQLRAGPHLRRAELLEWRSEDGLGSFIAVDITAAYNSTLWTEPGQKAKVSKVIRHFLFARREAAFVILDEIETTDESYTPKVLLHALGKPITANERLVRGNADNGILVSADRQSEIAAGSGRMTQHILLPEQMRLVKIGGPDYGFYAQTVKEDGNPDAFDGVNLIEGSRRKAGDKGTDGWRIEVEPTTRARAHRFLQVLATRLAADSAPPPSVRLIENAEHRIVLDIGETRITLEGVDGHFRADW